MYIPQAMTGGEHLHVRSCARADVPQCFVSRERRTDGADIFCAVRDQLANRSTLFRGGVHLHVRTCAPLFYISRTAGRIALKFDMLLEPN